MVLLRLAYLWILWEVVASAPFRLYQLDFDALWSRRWRTTQSRLECAVNTGASIHFQFHLFVFSPPPSRRSAPARLIAMEDFLEPDFDPSSLRVPQLRSLLLRFNVALPSTARKADLVDAFHTHVASRASDIRASRARQARVKPNGKDIIDMTGAAQTQTPHQAEGEHAPAKKPAKRTARLSAAAAPARVRGGVRMGEKDSDEEPEQAAPVEVSPLISFPCVKSVHALTIQASRIQAPKRAKAKPRQSAPAAVSNRQSRASMLSPGRDEERIPEIKEEQVPKVSIRRLE